MEPVSMTVSKPIPVYAVVKAQYTSGRISSPVRADQSLYAQLKNVSGFPAAEEGQGLPLNKLRILDNLIERMKHLKGATGQGIKKIGLSEDSIDALIQQYSKELHSAIAKAAGPFSGISVEPGMVLNMVV